MTWERVLMSKPSSYCEAGTLPPPGPVGRLVRLLFGLLCMWFLFTGILTSPADVVARFPHNDNLWPWAVAALYLFSYVVNIGFGQSWGRWPQGIIILSFLLVSATSKQPPAIGLGRRWRGCLSFGWPISTRIWASLSCSQPQRQPRAVKCAPFRIFCPNFKATRPKSIAARSDH